MTAPRTPQQQAVYDALIATQTSRDTFLQGLIDEAMTDTDEALHWKIAGILIREDGDYPEYRIAAHILEAIRPEIRRSVIEEFAREFDEHPDNRLYEEDVANWLRSQIGDS